MPEKWKRMAQHIIASEEARGVDPKTAANIGYGKATESWEKRHGGQTPQESAGEKLKHSKKKHAILHAIRSLK